jgi:D-alanyl-lipoteichoic acid acyltransferase DltB (MBOAT superfamily)
MKMVLNFFMFLLAFITFSNKSLSLTNYQIKRFCAKEKRVSLCIKNLKEKRSDLQEGKLIEIPVTTYKR